MRSPELGGGDESPLSLLPRQNFLLADFRETLLERHAVKSLEVEICESSDPIFQLAVYPRKVAALLILGSGKGRGVGHSPMRRDRLPRPHRTNLRRRRIANRKHKIHPRRPTLRKLIPTLAPQPLRGKPRQFQLLQCKRIHPPRRMTPRTETMKVRRASSVQNCLPKNRPRRIPRAQKQHIENFPQFPPRNDL